MTTRGGGHTRGKWEWIDPRIKSDCRIDTQRTQPAGCSAVVRMQPRSRCDQSRLAYAPWAKSMRSNSVSRPARSQSAARISHAIRCSARTARGMARLCNGMHGNGLSISETSPHKGPRQGPRQARSEGRRPPDAVGSGAAITCGAVSCTVCTCTYVVQAGVLRIVCTSSTRHHKRRLGMVPFFLRTLDSHVTRWDRIEPALIRPPRIPAARGRTRDPRR